jgi:hypothetical protein
MVRLELPWLQCIAQGRGSAASLSYSVPHLAPWEVAPFTAALAISCRCSRRWSAMSALYLPTSEISFIMLLMHLAACALTSPAPRRRLPEE